MLALIERLLKYLLMIAVGVLTVSVFLQVLIRFVFRTPLPWTEEVARIAFVYSIFIGATLGVRLRAHINVDFLIFFLSSPLRRFLAVVSATFVAGFLAVWIWQGVTFVQATGIQMTPVLLFPFAYLYIVIPVSGVLMLLFLVTNIVEDMRRRAVE